jgi:hypothetical protein
MELPKYETTIVSIPVVTRARQRSLPNRLGPWPLKRTRSEADWDNVPLNDLAEESTEKINLRTVLTRLDEECAAIDKVLIRDADGKTLVGTESPQEKDHARKPHVNQVACRIMGVFMAVAMILVFISTPLMTFIFADADEGKIYLHENAPSKTGFALMLSIPVILVGSIFGVAMISVVSHKRGWNPLRTTSEAVILVVGGLVVGGVLDAWVLAWLLPLVGHD